MKHPKTCFLPASPSSSSSPLPSPTSPSGSDTFALPGRERSRSGPPSLSEREDGRTGARSAGGGAGVNVNRKPSARGSKWLEAEPRPDFIELLARSNFSFLQGASHPEELVLRAKRLGYRGLAICDVNGMYGVVRGYQAAEKPSAFDTEQLAQTTIDGRPLPPFQYICGSEVTPYDASPVTLLPMNKDGYSRLCRLITSAKRKAPKGHIVLSLKDILENDQDLIAIALPPWKEPDLKKLQEVFGDRLYLPVYKDFTWESIRHYQQAMQLEQSLGLTLFATQRPLFHEPERKPLHDVLTCILHHSTLDEAATRLTLNRERYLKPPESLALLFRERPDLLTRTMEIANRLTFSLTEIRYRYPQENLPAGKTAHEFLRELVEAGIAWRYAAWTPPEFMMKVRKAVEHELTLITEMEYEDYFLTLWDICQFARKQGILHQGRGSAANSVVCFALGLTSVDPVRLGLLFERFISRERGEPPDIDIDFEHERREEVIQYIYSKYGERRAAMVCTVICYRSRMAIREVAKVMGLTNAQTDSLVKFMGREGLSRLLDNSVDITQFGLSESRFRHLLARSLELQGFPRHLGIHTGGFVISNESIVDLVPVESASMEGRYVIQWNKDDIQTLGLMKIDVLSLGMLTAVRKCLDLLRAHKGVDWNLAQIPHEDRATYTMIQKADTVGVFQIESRAQMSILPRLKPRTYYDLVISVAIVRPGPIQGGMVHPFLNRRAGRERVTYAHSSLVPILNKTLGIPLFQEQVMQIAVVAAGFTPGEADELRRVISSAWKKKTIMDGLHDRVVNGMLSNGIGREYAEQIYKTIEGFSSYGFPESHSASFALITYASCYLKCHYPDVFACALLNSQPMGFYSPRQLIADAQRHGIQFLALDVQHSDWDYTLQAQHAAPSTRETSSGLALKAVTRPLTTSAVKQPAPRLLRHAIRVGFRSIYGLREEHVRSILEARSTGGAFKDLSDFVKRTRLPKNAVIRLAAAGALGSFGFSPRETMWMVQGLSFDSQSLLFGTNLALDEARLSEETHAIPGEDDWQSVHREYQTKGFSLESHPMAVLRPYLIAGPSRYVTAKALTQLRNRTRVRVAGLMSLMQKPPTAKGMCFVSLEDETGLLNVIIVPDLYQKCRLVLMNTPLLEVDGWLECREGVYNIKAAEVRPLLGSQEARLAVGREKPLGQPDRN